RGPGDLRPRSEAQPHGAQHVDRVDVAVVLALDDVGEGVGVLGADAGVEDEVAAGDLEVGVDGPQRAPDVAGAVLDVHRGRVDGDDLVGVGVGGRQVQVAVADVRLVGAPDGAGVPAHPPGGVAGVGVGAAGQVPLVAEGGGHVGLVEPAQLAGGAV